MDLRLCGRFIGPRLSTKLHSSSNAINMIRRRKNARNTINPLAKRAATAFDAKVGLMCRLSRVVTAAARLWAVVISMAKEASGFMALSMGQVSRCGIDLLQWGNANEARSTSCALSSHKQESVWKRFGDSHAARKALANCEIACLVPSMDAPLRYASATPRPKQAARRIGQRLNWPSHNRDKVCVTKEVTKTGLKWLGGGGAGKILTLLTVKV
jgi:hypothetical protein